MLGCMEIYDGASTGATETRRWLTTVLRPVGLLDRAGLDQMGRALGILAACSDMVVIDLTAATVTSPQALARTLIAPSVSLDKAGRCLLLRGVPPQVRVELDRAAAPVVALAEDALPA